MASPKVRQPTSTADTTVGEDTNETSSASYYLRIDIDDTEEALAQDNSQLVATPYDELDLTFVDLYSRLRTEYSASEAQIEELTNAVQDHLQLCSRTDLIVFRWPWLIGPEDEPHTEQIRTWIERLIGSEGGEPVLGRRIRVGVIQHHVAHRPHLYWGRWDPNEDDLKTVVPRLRAVEIEALIRRHNAIWEPTNYHYRLPNGNHSDIFIRVADAINEPQDAYVMACWLTDQLCDRIGMVVDTGGLTPLIVQLESFLTRFDWAIGPTAILDAYPAGRALVRQTVENAHNESTTRIMAVLSVSSTGTLQRHLMDELEHIALNGEMEPKLDYVLNVIVNRVATSEISYNIAFGDDSRTRTSWWNIARDSPTDSSGICSLCGNSEKAPLVGVDPRTYGAMALPVPHLVMPDTDHARAAQLFWERVSKYGGPAIEVKPHPSSRGARAKRSALPVRPLFEVMCQPAGLQELVNRQYSLYGLDNGLERVSLIVTTPEDVQQVTLSPDFEGFTFSLEESLREVLCGVGIDPTIPIVAIDYTTNNSKLISRVQELGADDTILIFAWGSVTGLTLRNLKLSVADALTNVGRDVSVNGLVFHARLSHPKEWSAQQNQFAPGTLVNLWSSCFPWSSPIVEEQRLLDRSDFEGKDISDLAASFLSRRRYFLDMYETFSDQDDDWSSRLTLSHDDADPKHVFWGMSGDTHQQSVRGRSLYGRELDCVTAYAAIGSAINHTRFTQNAQAAPRWVMFDMGRIVRSYFDAVIICSMMRWMLPGELWWAERDEPDEIRSSVQFLLDQAADNREQVILIPELLLACAQGKVPTLAHYIVEERAKSLCQDWPSHSSFDMARGAVEIGLKLMQGG